MDTPIIVRLGPSKLEGYDRSRSYDEQDPRHGIPRAFCDAMAVREAVFVGEQAVPLECEHDADDARSCHWVVYASAAPPDPETASAAAAAAAAASVPVGTLRVVPYPQPPHPVPGGRYVDNELVESPAAAAAAEAETTQQRLPGLDRATSFHDGREPYVKIGRLAVLSAYRGRGLAGQLWRAAREWLEENPGFFERDVSSLSAEELEANPPRWNGLVCMHAQDRPEVLKTYQKWGFQIDEKMGRWWEEGIPHVGMFIRLNIRHIVSISAAAHVA